MQRGLSAITELRVYVHIFGHSGRILMTLWTQM